MKIKPLALVIPFFLAGLTGCNFDGSSSSSTADDTPSPTLIDDEVITDEAKAMPRKFWGLNSNIAPLHCYAIQNERKAGYVERKDLIDGVVWGLNSNKDYTELKGEYRKSDTSYEYFSITEVDGEALSSAELKQRLQNDCKRAIESKYPSYRYRGDYAIRYYAGGSPNPVLDSEAESVVQPKLDGAINYMELLRYAYAAKYAYAIEAGINTFPYFDDPTAQQVFLKSDRSVDQLAELKPFDDETGVSYGYAVAVKVPAVESLNLKEEVIIAYKGTANRDELNVDAQLMLANLGDDEHLENWFARSYDFYRKVVDNLDKPICKSSYDTPFQDSSMTDSNCYPVVITGHSLGGFLASDVGARTGIATRTFSSPATLMVDSFLNIFDKQMPLNNVTNFYRKGDPVVNTSGRHIENNIAFPSPENTLDPAGSHYLAPAIEEIYRPLALEKTNMIVPTLVKIRPDAMLGSGLNASVNFNLTAPKESELFANATDPGKYPLSSAANLNVAEIADVAQEDYCNYSNNTTAQIYCYFQQNGVRGSFNSSVDGKKIEYIKFEQGSSDTALVVVSGRTETFLKYAEFVYDILQTNKRNYSIYLLDHRSQGFSDRLVPEDSTICYQDKDRQLSAAYDKDKCQRHHLNNFENMTTDLHTFITDVVQPTQYRNMLVYGHSMGGGLTTRYIQQYPDTFDAAFLSAPMHGIHNNTVGIVDKIADWTSRPKTNYIWGAGPWLEPTTDEEKAAAFAGDHTTSRPRWDMVLNVWQDNPQVQMMGITWGWLDEALKAIAAMENDVNNITIPVTIMQASKDTAVDNNAQVKRCKAINATDNGGSCNIYVVRGSKHEAMIEQDPLRGFFMTHLLDFLDQHDD